MANLANKRPYKFGFRLDSMGLSIIITILATLLTFLLIFEINEIDEIAIPAYANSDESNINMSALQENSSKKFWLSIFKDICTVAVSILGTNLLLNLIIQKNSQNNLYDEFIIELLQNKDFLGSIPEDKRKILFKNIEEMDFLGENKIYTELINNVREKIVKSHYPFYYVSNNIDIICTLKPDCIEKDIIKTIEICSFEKSKKIEQYKISKFTLESLNEEKPVEIKKITINGKSKDINRCVEYTNSENEDNVYFANVNYNTQVLCCLKDEITVYNDKPTKIEINYITRVPLNDKVYIYRLTDPCKKFHFHYRIKDSNKKYKIHAQAFGFQDNAMKNPAGSRENEITYDIGDWAFPTDGVFVAFYE